MTAIIEFFKQQLQGEKPLHPIDRAAAKFYVKQRLAHIFPELRGNPEALEQAYRDLDLRAHPGTGEGGATVFETIFTGKL